MVSKRGKLRSFLALIVSLPVIVWPIIAMQAEANIFIFGLLGFLSNYAIYFALEVYRKRVDD